jgi:hypothetical protein
MAPETRRRRSSVDSKLMTPNRMELIADGEREEEEEEEEEVTTAFAAACNSNAFRAAAFHMRRKKTTRPGVLYNNYLFKKHFFLPYFF